MNINLEKGISIQVDGELGKYHTLPIDSLTKIAQNLQNLIFAIANTDLPQDGAVSLDPFQIELSGFSIGSAVPEFSYTPRAELKSGFHFQEYRDRVNNKLENLFEISDSGDYSKLLETYPDPEKRTPIVENLYTFANGLGSTPVRVVKMVGNSFVPLYGIKRFKSGVKEALVIKFEPREVETAENGEAVAKVKITHMKGRVRKTIMNLYSQEKYSIEYSPSIIVCGTNKYILEHPLRCLFEKEDGYYVIHSEMLDIIATGNSQDEAEDAFGNEFEYVYNLLNSHGDNQLTKHNLFIKNAINKLVKSIEV